MYEIRDDKIEDLIYQVAHDLVSPLKSIKSYLQVIKDKKDKTLDEDVESYLEKIGALCTNGIELTTEFLNLSLVSRQSKEFAQVSLEDLVSSSLLNLTDLINSQQAIVIVEDSIKDKVVYCEQSLIKHIFQNLVSNGIKFNKSQPPKITIGVLHQYGESDKYTIFVKDNGIGIPEKDQQRIFQMFERSSRTEEFEGAGIGLTIVKKAIDAHKESIWVKSSEGRGTIFFFNLRKGRNDGQESYPQG